MQQMLQHEFYPHLASENTHQRKIMNYGGKCWDELGMGEWTVAFQNAGGNCAFQCFLLWKRKCPASGKLARNELSQSGSPWHTNYPLAGRFFFSLMLETFRIDIIPSPVVWNCISHSVTWSLSYLILQPIWMWPRISAHPVEMRFLRTGWKLRCRIFNLTN